MLLSELMDDETRAKWRVVREAPERSGKTQGHIYRRAVSITSGKADPGPFGDFPGYALSQLNRGN